MNRNPSHILFGVTSSVGVGSLDAHLQDLQTEQNKWSDRNRQDYRIAGLGVEDYEYDSGPGHQISISLWLRHRR